MKKWLLVVGLLTVVWSAQAAPFPLCMYDVHNPADVPVIKEAGFTCIQSYYKNPEKLAPLAQAAAENGLQTVFYPNEVIGSGYEQAAQNWPMLAWYLVDEPDVWKWPRSRVTAAHEKARAAFPRHETALVIGQGRTTTPFYDLPDNLMMDWYPVPHLALTSFGDNVRWAKEGQTAHQAGEKPLWGVVQIFDWKEYKQHRPDNERIGRFPTQEEIRFMSYDGIVNGAAGLFYFNFNTRGTPLPTAQPEWWSRVKAVTQELARLRPVLENGQLVKNPLSVRAPLVLQTRLYEGYLYLILLNRSDGAVPVPKRLLKKKYTLFSVGEKADKISPYGVWVLKKKK